MTLKHLIGPSNGRQLLMKQPGEEVMLMRLMGWTHFTEFLFYDRGLIKHLKYQKPLFFAPFRRDFNFLFSLSFIFIFLFYDKRFNQTS